MAMLGGVGLGGTGCAVVKKVLPGPPPPPPPAPKVAPEPAALFGRIEAAADLNPSVSRRPSPLLLRIYELKALDAFLRAEFMALYQADAATLGADLVARDEMMVAPGQSLRYNKALDPQTRHIAVFAAYRDVERATWRASVAVPREATYQLDIQLGADAVRAALGS